MKYSFFIPKIETRSKEVDGVPNYVIKGYAATPDNIYQYKTDGTRSFKEYFSEKAIENIKRKIQNEKIFVDTEHITGTKNSSEFILKQLEEKTGQNFSEEIDYIKTRLKYSDIPMFKVNDIQIDDKGLFVDVRGNPFYREIDEEHKTYFDSVWGSLENGFINGMSLNFKPTKTIQINDGLTQIDDIDIFGISLTGNASNDMASITEVAMRSIEHIRGGSICQKTSSLLL